METEILTWEELRSQICAVDEVLDKLSKVNKKHSELTKKYQAALIHIRNLERNEFDSGRLLNQYKALQDEHNHFVNASEIRYQNTCKEYIDKIKALETAQQKTCKKQPQGGKNSQKLREMYVDVCAKYVKVKGHSSKLESEVNNLKKKLQEHDDQLLRMQLENSSAEIQAKEKHEKEIEFLKQQLGSLRILHKLADEQEEWNANGDAVETQEKNGDEVSPASSDVDKDLFNEAISTARSIVALSPLPPSPQPSRFRNNIAPHSEDLVEVTLCDGSLQSQSDCVFSSPASVNQELHFLDKIPMHTQTEEFPTYCTASTQITTKTTKNKEEVDLIRELVEPKNVDSGNTMTDTEGDNDSVILDDMLSKQENAKIASNESENAKKKPMVHMCFPKGERECRKQKMKSSHVDYHDSPKRQHFELEKTSNKKGDRENSVQCESDTKHNRQIREQKSIIGANKKGNLKRGMLDLPVLKNKSSSVTTKGNKLPSVLKKKSAPLVTTLNSQECELSMQSSMVNMMTTNHNNLYNDFSVSKQCTTVSRPVIADRSEKLIERINPIPNQKPREPVVLQEKSNCCNISYSSLSPSTADAGIQIEKESATTNQSQPSRDNFDLTEPLYLEMTITDPNNPRPTDEQKVIEISDTDSELGTSFQSQSAKAKKRCRKISKKDLAAGITLGFKDSCCSVTKSGTGNTAARNSPLVKMTTNTSEKSNASLLRTPVSKKRGAIAKKKLENVSVMTTRSATRKQE